MSLKTSEAIFNCILLGNLSQRKQMFCLVLKTTFASNPNRKRYFASYQNRTYKTPHFLLKSNKWRCDKYTEGNILPPKHNMFSKKNNKTTKQNTKTKRKHKIKIKNAKVVMDCFIVIPLFWIL